MWIQGHHQLPESRGWTRANWNILRLHDVPHINYHRIFKNDTVNEAIIRILDNFNPTVLSEEFRNDIEKILKEWDLNYYYKKWIYLPKN